MYFESNSACLCSIQHAQLQLQVFALRNETLDLGLKLFEVRREVLLPRTI